MSEKEPPQENFSFKNYFVPFTTTKAIHWIILIGLLLYFNSLFNSFVGDDLGQIIDNPTVHSILNISTFFTSSTFYNGGSQYLIGVYYKPLLLTFYSLIYTFFGPNYVIFHLFQVILCIANAVIVFLFLKHFFKQSLSFILSIIFLVHPINSEVAFYIADLQDVLFFFFGISALVIIQKYHSTKAIFTTSLLLFCSLLSKETGILFLIVSLVYVFITKRKNFLCFLGFLSLFLCIYLLLRVHAIGIFVQPTSSPIAKLPLNERIISMPAMFLFYLKTLFFPATLATDYQWVYTSIDYAHFYLPLFIDILFLLLVAVSGFILFKKYNRKSFLLFIAFACWFLGGALFHLQIIPLDATVAERWMYFPIIGILGMIGVLLQNLRISLRNLVPCSIIFIIIILLSVRTVVRSFDWRNDYTLATHDIGISKDSYSLENLLSYVYFQKGQYKIAKVYAEQSIALFPRINNYLNLGAADFHLGDYQGAKKAYLKALQYGDYNQTYDSLAFMALSYGNPSENISFIKNRALPKFSQDGKLWLCLAALEYNFGNKQNAVYEIQQAYRYDPETQTIGVYNAIMNNKPVRIGLKSLTTR
jgi:protein O-mannosyl-transferase